MSKVKSFFCQKCGTKHAQWQGQCNSCKEWNTVVEEIIEKPAVKGWTAPDKEKASTSQPISIADISTNEEARLHCPTLNLTGFEEEDLSQVLSPYLGESLG